MKTPATDQKLRGGYYTPKSIADFLAEWAIHSASAKVLEPSCGDGNIIEAAISALLKQGADRASIAQLVQGVELDETEAVKATKRLHNQGIPTSNGIYVGDFFHYCQDHLMSQLRFDAIVGNPPFIRYQHFQEEHRAIAFRLMEYAGLHPTRLTNAWVPFLVCSTLLLNPHDGRMAMVIPAELLQVTYAAELRRFLADHYSRITLFTFKKLVFQEIQQEVVLFLGERDGHNHTGIRIVELDGIDDLADYGHTLFSTNGLKFMDHSREKWVQYYLDQDEIDLLRALRKDNRLTPLGKVAQVDVGVVTGLNDFFVLTERRARDLSLLPYTQPIVTRSGHIQGIQFTANDLSANMANQLPSFLLSLPTTPFDKLPEAAKSYVTTGELQGYHKGYKCRIRNYWYSVPSTWVPDAFMLRQVHSYPKLAINKAGATSTDTIHRVKLMTSVSPTALASAFLNSATFVFAEVMGRSYGGGVLELEPTEAESLPVPLINAEVLDWDDINHRVIRNDIENVLDLTDRTLLVDGLGLNHADVKRLRTAWRKLRDRRINRNHQRARHLSAETDLEVT